MNAFSALFPAAKPIIGVIHLPPLPGFAGHPGMREVIAHALGDLEILMAHGVDGVLVENEHDKPHEIRASAAVIDAMKQVTRAIVEASEDIVAGCEILLNDPIASLDVAKDSGARFIRCDYFVDRMSRPQYGEFEIDPVGLVRYRNEVAPDVLILADIQVKYATMLEQRSLAQSAALAAGHGADAVVVTGDATGDAPRLQHLHEAVAGIASGRSNIPVIIGSGLKPENASSLLPACGGAIVGTSLMRDGKVHALAAAALMREVGKVSAS